MHAGHSKLMAIYATWVWDDGYHMAGVVINGGITTPSRRKR